MILNKKIIFIVFLLQSICINSQTFNTSLVNIENDRIQFIFPDDDKLIIIGEYSVWEYTKGKIQKYRDKTNKNKNINFNNFTLIDNNNKLLAIENGLGRVYEITKDSLIRIDNSSSLKNNYGNSIFIHNEEIISYGGYGFWKYHDYFTRFSWKDKEWFIIRNKNYDLPSGRTKAFFQVDGNKLYLAGGESSGGYLSDVVLFDLETMESKKIGSLNSLLKTRSQHYITLDDVNYYLQPNGLSWLKVSFKENYFSRPKPLEHLKNHNLRSNPTFLQDSIFYFCKHDELMRLNSISVEDFKKSFNNKEFLYRNKTKFNQYVIFLLGVVILIILRILYLILHFKKSKYYNVYLQKHYLTYKKSIIVLTEEENLILRNIIEEKEFDIQDIIEINKYLYGFDQKEILKNIKSLNLKFKKDKGISKIIQIKKTDNGYELIGTITKYDGWYKYFWGKP